jgi:hypothetical protein
LNFKKKKKKKKPMSVKKEKIDFLTFRTKDPIFGVMSREKMNKILTPRIETPPIG